MNIVFMGTPDFALPSFIKVKERFGVSAVITQPPRPAGRGMKKVHPPLREVALRFNTPVYQPETKKDLESLIEYLSPDCIITVAYGRILSPKILAVPPYGVLNLHASLLPKYRGPAPIQRALMAGEKITGNTVFLVNEKMDSGDILLQETVSVREEDNFVSLSQKLALQGAVLLIKALDLWFKGKIKPIPQKEEKATYAPPIRNEEFKICWKASAESVRDRIRGLYPNAYTFFRGNRIKILKVRVVKGMGDPGEILGDKTFTVACGKGAVEILELISPKGKKIKGEDFIRGYNPQRGELLK